MLLLSQFDEYREDNIREVKKAEGGLPVSLWDTYSSFANCYGGVIILGVKENKDGTFRRNFEGDYHCTRLQVKTMLCDQTERTMDMEVLDKVSMEDLNYDTIHGYRNSHRSLKEGHPFERLSDHEYLRSIGAAAISDEDGKLHPTAAGMLMFGDEYNIVRHFPEYFLDYREELDPTTRWSDRLQSSSGEWSGNVCDFYFEFITRLSKISMCHLKWSVVNVPEVVFRISLMSGCFLQPLNT